MERLYYQDFFSIKDFLRLKAMFSTLKSMFTMLKAMFERCIIRQAAD